jgi:hypothetical protein
MCAYAAQFGSFFELGAAAVPLRVNMSETLPPSEFRVEGGEELSNECAA